ncbi:hypothetical protein AC578_5255 [Pseudocercospora eumusae]|uniref:Dipeptidase n=1 Tax=Pseudocercospora eumusae TaxID=321146 RepID=A0A139GZD3_9PEZI|nr:hypothetical protein AC578_5255 [Pseudocercospora eumusae]
MAEGLPDDKKKDQSDNKPSPILERAIADSKSNNWTLFQLLFILSCVVFGYTVFDPQKLAEFFSTKSAHGTSFASAELATAHKILKENPLIDGHNDLLILIRALYNNHIYQSNFTKPFEEGDFTGHFDLPRADAGQLGGSFWSAWIPCPSDGFDFSDANYAPYVRATLDQIDLFKRLSAKYPKYFTLSTSAAQAEANFEAGKLISPLAIEGLHQIGNSIATLRLYHELGVRYATLNWNCHNLYTDAAVVSIDGVFQRSKPHWHGVSPLGRQLILEMNRLGMLVDLSHVSPDTMRDVLGGNQSSSEPQYQWDGSLAPPIFSHSSVYAICPHPRNVPDEILQLVKERNSIVMVNFAPEFISCRQEDPASETGLPEYVDDTNTIDQVVSHITYIGDLIGYDHVGLGSDFDGITSTPRGLESVADYPKLIELLLKKGVSEEDCAKIAGRNLLRVWHEVDRVKERLEREGLQPLEEDVGRSIGGASVRSEKGGVELDYH